MPYTPHKCPPTEPRRQEKEDPRSAKRGQFINKKKASELMSYAKKKGLPAPLMASTKMGKATKYKKYLAGLKAATAGGGKGSGTGGSEFIKRRMKLAGAGSALGRAAKASKYGKIALGIAGAGIAAHQYLKSKMKKNKDGTPKKKMGGGMMNKPIMAREGRLAAYARKKGLPLPLLKKGFKGVGKFPFIKGIGKKDISKKMGGGMMMRPRGYKIGTGKKPLETAMNEKRAEQTENVKRLTTQSDAYDPETRYIFGERRTRSGGLRVGKKTTDWSNLKEEAKKVKDKYPGMNVGVYTPKEAEYAGFTRRRNRGKPTRSTLANQAQQQSAMAKQQKMTIGGSVTVKTKIGKNFPTKTY